MICCSSALRKAVTVDGMLAHERKFQSFAQDSVAAFGFPTRVDGSVGFTESVKYVADTLRDSGYEVTEQKFTFDRFVENSAPAFQQVAPTAKTYTETPDGVSGDFATMEYSGSGDVTANVQATNDIVIPPGATASTSNSGCEAADFTGFVRGNIALIQRGTCLFRDKVLNAQAAGASAVIIFNEGQPGRTEVLNGTLSPPQVSVPVIGTSFAVGADLYQATTSNQPMTARAKVDATVINTSSSNVIADTTSGRTDRTVLVVLC